MQKYPYRYKYYTRIRVYTRHERIHEDFFEGNNKGNEIVVCHRGPICPPLTVIRGRSSINLVCIYRVGQEKLERNGTRVPENHVQTLTRTMFLNLRFTVNVGSVVRTPKDINQLFQLPVSTCSGVIFHSLSFLSPSINGWILTTIVYLRFVKGQKIEES